jgi:hypothetical protein
MPLIGASGLEDWAEPGPWRTVPKRARKAAQEGLLADSVTDSQLLTCLFLRAALAGSAFATICLAFAVLFIQCVRLVTSTTNGLLITLAAACGAELAFYALAWRPRYLLLNSQPQPAHRPQNADFDAYHALRHFLRCGASRTSRWICIREMLSAWFGGVPVTDIHLGNLAQLVAYGFFYMTLCVLMEERAFVVATLSLVLWLVHHVGPTVKAVLR